MRRGPVGKVTPFPVDWVEGKGESKRTRDSWLLQQITIQRDGAPGQMRRWRRSRVSLAPDTRDMCEVAQWSWQLAPGA